jgi:hypothetical protein
MLACARQRLRHLAQEKSALSFDARIFALDGNSIFSGGNCVAHLFWLKNVAVKENRQDGQGERVKSRPVDLPSLLKAV